MPYTYLLLLLASAGLCSGSFAAAAPDAELARKWAGTYTDHQEIGETYFHITIDHVSVNGNVITTHGQAKYFDGEHTSDLSVEWVIDNQTLFVDMWESSPVGGRDDYDVSGSYKGSISRNLDTIFAIWRNRAQNSSGTLKLKSVEVFPDYRSSKNR